ncbi:MAG: hydroxymethylglutaryl-CoA reductase, degradative [candidate division Zixibacteria bacterium]|nr:hydroxymethylglutaryl-CoA reductase, degradative [candidate division Zixibacteria bacterium]
MDRFRFIKKPPIGGTEFRTSRIPGFYRLSVEQRLAFLARSFNLDDEQVSQLRNGNALRMKHAVNMVENAVGVFGLPLGLGLNFLVDGREYLVPMAIEEASIIAAASKAALIIRKGGGFRTRINDPVMIGQVQVLDLKKPQKAVEQIKNYKEEIIAQANLANPRMVQRGGGVFDIETRVLDGGEDVGEMLVVHLLFNVCEAMGANAVNYACEAVGSLIEKVTGGRVNLRILSNLADKRIARAEFTLPFEHLTTKEFTGEEVAHRLVEADRLAHVDPYRATTHNKGIFNGLCAAALALGQDWRAIEAGGHAYAARDGRYRGLTTYKISSGCLHGEIELPLQTGSVGGAVKAHPGVQILRAISGVENARQLAGLLSAVGLGQNFAALLALSTVGIQKGHMALHARSVAVSVGVPPNAVEEVTQEMIRRGEVKVTVAEDIYRRLQKRPKQVEEEDELPVETFAPGKIVLFGEHATVYNYPGIAAAINIGVKLKVTRDPDGPRFLHPHFKKVFSVPKSDQDIQLFSNAVDVALGIYDLRNEPIAIQIESELVPGMGLGSSAAFSTALCSALRQYKHLKRSKRWDSDFFDEVQSLEAIFHGHPSGMDAATILSEGVLWFRKGPPREFLPIQVPTPISGVICLVEPGARTIELVKKVANFREQKPKYVNGILEDIGNLTVDAGIALGTGDTYEIGKLMFRNHELLAKLGVSTPALDRAVELLLDNGAIGAKITGSGGGGAVIGLVEPGSQFDLMESLSHDFPMVLPFTLGALR